MKMLKNITELSHEFGTEDFVKGGGGNTSCKDDMNLWVKPSGTTLSGITEEAFVILDRDKIKSLFRVEIPSSDTEKEKLVQRIMKDAVIGGSNARPSLEAPLHNLLNSVYVVHTHPALVNGMTCGKNGKEKCAELFPESLWVEYYNPGFSLCSGMEKILRKYRAGYGKDPELIFLKNHGVFVSSNTVEGIHITYSMLMNKLDNYYNSLGIQQTMPEAKPVSSKSELILKELLGDIGAYSNTNIPFDPCRGPLSPDHVVYSKGRPYEGELSQKGISSFLEKYGYYPRVFYANDAVITTGATQKTADLAMLMARDAALVFRLTAAFGGPDFMSDTAGNFIENWEAESYRSRVAEQ
jgi:rhamnose utilization protein RhaD (predicted bifunctional aldolase and dehydrogenase)